MGANFMPLAGSPPHISRHYWPFQACTMALRALSYAPNGDNPEVHLQMGGMAVSFAPSQNERRQTAPYPAPSQHGTVGSLTPL
jgi:hypothetical protein